MKKLHVFLLIPVLAVSLLLSSSQVSAQGADEQFSFAQSLQKDRLYEAASQEFLKFALKYPGDDRAPFALENAADCLEKIGSKKEAADVLTSLIDSYPKDPGRCKNQVHLGRLYHSLGNFEEANRVFTEIVVTNPDCPQMTEAMLGRGEALLALKRYNEAIDVFTALVKTYKDPRTSPKAYFGMAMAESGMGEKKEALKAYALLGKLFPKHPLSAFAFLESARLHVEMGDSLAAVAAYENAKSFKEKAIFIPACMEGAEILEGMKRYADALSWLQQVLKRNDADNIAEVYERAVRAAYLAGSYEEVKNLAVLYYQDPKRSFSPEVAFFKARAELKLSEFDKSLEDAKALETKAPESDRAKYAPMLKGEALLGGGRPREAIGEFRRFASAVSDSAMRVEALSKIAGIYMVSLGDTAKALDVLLEKLDVEKKRNAEEFFNAARLFEKAHNYKEAKRLYEEIVAGFPFTQAGSEAQERLDYIEAFVVLDPSRALSKMEKTARDIISLPKPEGMLLLAETRMDMMKDFAGSIPLLDQAIAGASGGEVLAKALYYKGSCYAGETRKALASGDSVTAKGKLAEAAKVWNTLESRFGNSSWSGRAVYEGLFLRARVAGSIDTLAVLRTLSMYPARSERATAFEMLGDYWADLSGAVPLRSRIRYYSKALLAAEGLADASEVRLKLADAYLEEGSFEKSLGLARAVLQDKRIGMHLRASYQTAVALRQLKKYGEAIPLFQEVARTEAAGTFGTKALLQAADCMYLSQDYEQAVKNYSETLNRATSNTLAWEVTYRLALCWDKLGKTADALQLLEKCIASPSGGELRPRAYSRALEMARSLGDNVKVGSLLESYRQEYKNTPLGLRSGEELFHWYLRNDQAQKALELSNSIIAASTAKDRLEARSLRAMALYRTGQLAAARALQDSLRSASADARFLWEVSLQEAWYHYDHKQYRQSLATARTLMQNCPEQTPCGEALFLATMSLFGSNQIKEAGENAALFFSKYPLDPLAPLVHLKFGNALSAVNKYEEAIAQYREAAATATDSSTTFHAMKNLAVARQKMSMWNEAAKVWTELLNKFPSSQYAMEASLNIARCKMEAGDLSGSVEAYRAALPILDDQGKARAYYWSGECYQKLRDFKSAIAEYLKVPYLVPGETLWAVTAQLKAAECYISIKRFESAQKIYEKIVQKYGENSDWGKAARNALEKMKVEGGTQKKAEG